MDRKCIFFYDEDVNVLNDYLAKGWKVVCFSSATLGSVIDANVINYVIIEKPYE